jgi:hypothetical protein
MLGRASPAPVEAAIISGIPTRREAADATMAAILEFTSRLAVD